MFGRRKPSVVSPPTPRKGELWVGEVRRCTDPELVSWPGHYAVEDGYLAFEVQWDESNPNGPCWVRKA